ncbi:pilus assembly protein PilP [Moraxella bovis]|uniref:Pilus assembly protein PilP n=1 Tax=Moraxella bovis TaxID=476 RepID=A0A378PQ45_MORBO|nr:pilus assembly protein PilP [Moraxella bovis]UYZ67997.1 pilus assembly protein PilP [Moraxella bovis]UYZ70372.1 pilus assembly protein PilP [Moraxella bovis]UYZ73708.1 pilus assembly protein PilP [Moraxella bovis]UYZ75236.1 pilus assembly protein PilP [Moraxella bovis]UYZ78832.1 pilus assembly protein PilP [Moraxella bovis]
MINFSLKTNVGLVMLLSLLVGCTDRVSLAESEMQKIRSQGPQAIEPPPEPLKIEDFVYAAQGESDPFVPKSLRERQQVREQTPSVKPDENRVKEPLEEFELLQLTYRGKVVAPNGQEYGLVQTPDMMVHDVQVGNYLGKNHGRIVEITSTQINLIEIVKDTDEQYVEKTTPLVSPN